MPIRYAMLFCALRPEHKEGRTLLDLKSALLYHAPAVKFYTHV